MIRQECLFNMKNKHQILPLAIMLLLLTVAYAVPATGAGKGSFRQTSIGEAFPSPVAYTAEDEAMICSDAFITCSEEDASEAAALRVDHPQKAPDAPFSGQATISWYSELDSCHYPTKGGCLTASGKIAKYGMVATNLYPFGTKIRIEGLGVFTVEDRISKRYNNRIDVWVGYGKEANVKAKQMGLQTKLVEVL